MYSWPDQNTSPTRLGTVTRYDVLCSRCVLGARKGKAGFWRGEFGAYYRAPYLVSPRPGRDKESGDTRLSHYGEAAYGCVWQGKSGAIFINPTRNWTRDTHVKAKDLNTRV